MKEMYQIGSVVEVIGSNQKIPWIIISRLMQQPSGEIYDYIGLPYPYGLTGEKAFHGFNEEDIVKVLHEGYKTEISNDLQLFYQEKYLEMEKQEN